MSKPTIVCPDLKSALDLAQSKRPDAVGNRFHSFRIELQDPGPTATDLVSQLVDNGWHLMGLPLVVEASEDRSKHLLVSMMQSNPRPLELRAHLNLEGQFRADGELRGESRII